MKTKHFATDFILPMVLMCLGTLPVILIGLWLGLPQDVTTAAILVVCVVFALIEESLTARLARRLGFPAPRQIGKRSGA